MEEIWLHFCRLSTHNSTNLIKKQLQRNRERRILGIDRKQLLYCKYKQKPKQIFPNNVSSPKKMFQSNCWLSKILWTKTANHKNSNGCSSTLFCIWCRLAPALARVQYTEFPRCKFTSGFPSSCPGMLFEPVVKLRASCSVCSSVDNACSHLSTTISTPWYTWALGKASAVQTYIQNHQTP